jgi:hypothetical protein
VALAVVVGIGNNIFLIININNNDVFFLGEKEGEGKWKRNEGEERNGMGGWVGVWGGEVCKYKYYYFFLII